MGKTRTQSYEVQKVRVTSSTFSTHESAPLLAWPLPSRERAQQGATADGEHHLSVVAYT